MDGKICQKIKPPTPTHIPSPLREDQKTRLQTVFINVHFFILTASKNIKIQKIKLEVGFSYKDCI